MTRTVREAGVVLAIVATPPYGVIFVERAAHLRSHPGQIGLPGGTLDTGDEGDTQRAALRELYEEVGVESARVDVVGTLARVKPRVTPYVVTPYVAVVAPGPLQIDPSETAAVFTIPLATVLADVYEGTVRIGEFEIQSTLLEYEGWRIWGLTGRVLRHFADAWHDPQSPLRERIESRLRRDRTVH